MIGTNSAGRIQLVALLLVAVAAATTTEAYVVTVTNNPTAITTSSRQQQQRRHAAFAATALHSSTSARSSEADFSAFADSLDLDDDEDNKNQGSSSTSSKSQSSSSYEKPWQAKLEELFDPMTSGAQRQILLSELLNANEKIRESVSDALTNRKIDPLLTPTQRKLQDGTRAVVRQLANDILPQIQKSAGAVSPNNSRSFSSSASSSPFSPPSPSDIESIGSRLFSVVSSQIEKNLKELQDDLSDPLTKIPQRLEKQRTEVLQEARNVFLETPEGLEEPPYTVVESCDLYEIRDYAGYSVASTAVSTSSDSGSMEGVANGQAFNLLAAYLFGGNDEQKQMSMTTPVTTTSTGEMRFYLAPVAGGFPVPAISKSGASAPVSNAAVDIMEVPPARLAIRKFTGFVTDGEVARQKDTLLQALEMDGVELDVPHGAIVPHIVFQYNPPYTLPIVRRNEIAVPVRKVEDGAEAITSLKEEWNVDMDDDIFVNGDMNGLDDVSPSD